MRFVNGAKQRGMLIERRVIDVRNSDLRNERQWPWRWHMKVVVPLTEGRVRVPLRSSGCFPDFFFFGLDICFDFPSFSHCLLERSIF